MFIQNDTVLPKATAIQKSACYERSNVVHPTVMQYRYETTFFFIYFSLNKRNISRLHPWIILIPFVGFDRHLYVLEIVTDLQRRVNHVEKLKARNGTESIATNFTFSKNRKQWKNGTLTLYMLLNDLIFIINDLPPSDFSTTKVDRDRTLT